jgi:hypothetical protein
VLCVDDQDPIALCIGTTMTDRLCHRVWCLLWFWQLKERGYVDGMLSFRSREVRHALRDRICRHPQSWLCTQN